MNRAFVLVACLALAASAAAADRDTSKDKSGQTAKKPPARAKPGKGAAASAPAPKSEGAASRATLLAAARAKSTFIFSVEACDRPGSCDEALRAESEQQFMDACKTCAPEDRCEADRQAVLHGQGKASYNPCAAPPASTPAPAP